MRTGVIWTAFLSKNNKHLLVVRIIHVIQLQGITKLRNVTLMLLWYLFDYQKLTINNNKPGREVSSREEKLTISIQREPCYIWKK